MLTVQDQVILVDDQDQSIGTMDKIEAHRGEGYLHRASSVFIWDSKGKLLIQQRSHQKIVGAGQWANTCCGNVRPGESYLECAVRRLREEMGIVKVLLTEVHTFQYAVKCNAEFSEREIDHVFVGCYDGEVSAASSEVMAWEWIDFDEVIGKMNESEREWAPWFVIMMQNQALLATLKEFYDTT